MTCCVSRQTTKEEFVGRVDTMSTQGALESLSSDNRTLTKTFVSVTGLSHVSETILVIFLYVPMILVGVIGNGIVCYTVLCLHQMKTVTGYFIVNLACSDIIMAAVCIPFTSLANLIFSYWPFGDVPCPIVSYVQVVSVFVSAYTVVVVGIDRYIAIIRPLQGKLSKRHAVYMIGLVWLFSMMVSLPTAVTSRLIKQDSTSERGRCEEVWQNPRLRYGYSIIIMLLQYFLPVTFLVIAYGRVASKIWCNRSHRVVNQRDCNWVEKQKMVTIMMIVVALYIVCWLPLHVITLLGDMDPYLYDRPFMPVLWFVFHWLAMSNCCYNPFIYCWMSKKFRSGFKRVFRCCPCIWRFRKFRRTHVTRTPIHPRHTTASDRFGVTPTRDYKTETKNV